MKEETKNKNKNIKKEHNDKKHDKQEDVVKILARELNISLDEVNYDDLGTNILVETRKGQ